MARVYSWQINEAPKTYAYIVNPNNTETAYIGIELTGTNLQKVIDWASTCTDTQYESQFNKVKALCESSGYEVTFETVEAYMNVRSSCDNLRGPSGRGIQHITRVGVDSSTNTDTYAIYYNDGTYDTFTIQNGRDGRNGNDGKPGAQGDTGVSYRTIMAYTSGVDENGKEIEVKTPTGGSHNFITNKTDYPVGWQASDSKLTPPIWMSSRTFATIDSATDKTWTSPIQITGDNGEPGADGITTEFIYKISDKKPDDASSLPSDNTNDYVPTGWSDSPEGVDEKNQKEWYCLRKKEDNKWGKWKGPFIWSQYGVNGQDGDGVQYIYMKTKTGQPPANPTPLDWKDYDEYQDKDSEWIPPKEQLYTNIKGEEIFLVSETDGNTKAGIWADNPIPVTINYQYQWVSSRKYRMDSVKKTKIWTAYSDPALWGKFGEDGKSGTVIRKLYALSTDTGNPPDLPNSTSFTGNWGTGFPRDYKSGVNVVWGTEAEINISTNDFVMGYKKISITNENGVVIVPNGVNETNTVEADVLPDEKIDKQYVIFDGHYYEWSGGWCEAYLVTGVTGKPGDPVSYNTYYFHYGSADSSPDKPTRTDINNFKDKSFLDYKTNNTWEDFPNTTGGRIDNETNRWYQCCGLVGSDQIVKEWSSVYPCNAKDGETLPGVYIEMRFGTGLDDIPPTLNINTNEPKELRNPKLYDVNGNPCGWYTTSHELLVPSGGHMYEIWAKIDSATNTVVPEGDVYWNGPIRISGERGEQGIPGPAGLKGVSGIPGVSINTMFVLGTSKSAFAKKLIRTDGTDNATKKEMADLGWFDNKNIPDSDCIDMYDKIKEEGLKDGRVIRLYNTTKLNSFEGDVTTTTHYYYNTKLVSYETKELAELGLEKSEPTQNIDGLYQIKDFDDEADGIYIWCVQGDDVWELGKEYGYVKVEGIIANSDNTIILNSLPTKKEDYKTYKYAVYYGYCYEWKLNSSVAVPATIIMDEDAKQVSEIPTEKDSEYEYIFTNNNNTKTYYKWAALDGAEVKHKMITIDWGDPFRLQGTNGLRGLTGHRGQVVYPMGVYSHNEVYITTAEKAPYVYDPEDGMFYVYNITGTPWVGYLPDGYKKIMIHPDGVNADNTYPLKGNTLPTTQQKDSDGNKLPYLYSENGILVNNILGPKAYYKWNDETGGYVRVSKYKYSVSGNAIDDWMREQKTTPSTNYANATNNNETPAWVRFESFEALYTSIGIIENGMIGSAVYNNEFMFSQQGIDRDGIESNYAKGGMGFLSGYKYDNAEKKWIDENGVKIENSYDINPYKIGTDGKAIHKFRPNVCINFATGQMWTACGKCFHNYDGTGHLADQAIKWKWKDKNKTEIEVQIGYDGQNGITIDSNGFKIGLLDKYKAETDEKINAKTETWYGENIPSIDWVSDNERLEHDGDIWYCTKENGTYRKDATYRWNGVTKEWVEINVPQYIFDRFDGKSTIFVEKPTDDNDKDGYLYHTNDLWILEKDYEEEIGEDDKDKAKLAKPGTIWVANANGTTNNGFKWSDWDKKGTELDNWVNNEYVPLIDDIKEQVDHKAETWYQEKDPFVWTTKDEANKHIGDMWCKMGDNFTYVLYGNYIETTNKLCPNLYHTIQGKPYTWVSSSIPSSIFDWFDGKSTIFVTKPTTDEDADGYLYHVGDLWLTLTNLDENDKKNPPYLKENGIYKATVSRTSDEKFNVIDWEPASNYTDDTLAKMAFERFEAMAEDGYISPEERKILRKETANIETEYPALKRQAEDYGFDGKTSNYNSVYTEFIKAFNKDDANNKVSLLDVIAYFINEDNSIKNTTSKFYNCIEIDVKDDNDKIIPKTKYNDILAYYQAKDNLLNAFTEYANETAKGASEIATQTASEFKAGIEGITSTVMRMSIENLLNGTEFNKHDISYSTNTVFVCNTHKTGGTYTIYENDKELNGYNYVSVNAKFAHVGENNCVDIYQVLNEPGASQTFWKIKSKTDYTLHCKYRTEYNSNTANTTNYPGALYITASNPTYIEVNGVKKDSLPSDLCTYLEDTQEWKDIVIKFTTGTITNHEKQSNAFYIKTIIGSKVDIALLKLEEGHTPTPWRKTQDDISSTIKQTADSIKLEVKDDLGATGIDIEKHKITISGDELFIAGKTYFNETVVIDEKGNFKAQNATFDNIVINGSLASPFALDTDKGDIDIYHDNYAYNIQPGSALQTYSKNLKWTPDQSGRKVTITNYKWNDNESQGDINLTIPGYFNIKEYNGWERQKDMTNTDNKVFEVYSHTYYIPTTRHPFFNGEQTHIKITIPKNTTKFSFDILCLSTPIYGDNYVSPHYIIISKLNQEIPYNNLDTAPSEGGEKIKRVINGMCSEKITFDIPNDDKEYFINIAVRQISTSTEYSHTCAIYLPKDKADEQFYYENGIKKTHLVLKQNELINLIGYGDDNDDKNKRKFYGWIVENRVLISDANTLYGQQFKYLASGAIRTKTEKVNGVWAKLIDKEASHVETYDGSSVLLNVSTGEPGRFTIEFDDSWLNTISNCIVMATGYGKVLNDNGTEGETGMCKATVMPFKPWIDDGKQHAGIEIWVSDDASPNHGAFDFIMFNYKQMPSARIL